MSTRSSIYASPHIHMYHEGHDPALHVEITDESNSFVNFVLPPYLAKSFLDDLPQEHMLDRFYLDHMLGKVG